MMRRMGGWIEPHHGAHRVRTRANGKIETLAKCDTEEEAQAYLRGLSVLRSQGRVAVVDTLRTYGARWMDRRELRRLRSVGNDRSRWKTHVDAHPIADRPIASVSRREVRGWLEWLEPRADWATRRAALTLVRGCLAAAVDDEVRTDNPAANLKIEKPADAHETDGWTYLLPDEQTALLTRSARTLRPTVLIAAVALGTGLRQGEQWNLELRDVDADGESPSLLVRWGSKGKPPKSGKMRRVPLFGIALAAMREWIAGLPTYAPRNPMGLAFPTQRGCRRQRSKLPRGWSKVLTAAGLASGVSRHDGHTVRWHDLRHSCASSLVAGWWGRVWTLQEVRDVLGHSSVVVTERYAHLSEGVLVAAAEATPGAPLGSKALLPSSDETSENQARHARFERATFAFGGRGIPEDLRQLEALGEQLREQEERFLLAVAQRNRFARTIGMGLAEASKAYREAVEAVLLEEAPSRRAAGAGR